MAPTPSAFSAATRCTTCYGTGEIGTDNGPTVCHDCFGEGRQLDSLERTRLGLKGPVTTPIAGGFTSVNVALRKKLDLFANVRPVHTAALAVRSG